MWCAVFEGTREVYGPFSTEDEARAILGTGWGWAIEMKPLLTGPSSPSQLGRRHAPPVTSTQEQAS
jgi:hypothetical protein